MTTAAPRKNRLRTYDCICRVCGQTFTAVRRTVTLCKGIECQRQRWRESAHRWAIANPEKKAAIQARSIAKNPERFKATQARYRSHVAVPCGVCGRRRYNSRGVNPLCATCAATQRHAERAQPCKFCGRPQYRKHKRGFTWCDECLGQQSHAADLLGLTRERIRQLVNAKVAKVGGTKADALRLVLADRGVAS